VLMQSIERSMATGFTRLGADMLIVPAGTLTNLTAALLTAEATDLTLDGDMLPRLAALKGVRKVAPQLIFRTDASGYGRSGDLVDLIAFDPARDMTVQPWLEQRLDRPIRRGDLIIGGRRPEALGEELLLFGRPLTVYGKLGKTAVGTHERGLFITFETLAELREIMQQICGTKAALEPNKLSGVLLELAPGATTQQVRFAALAHFPGIKIVAGDTMLTSIRQGLAGLLTGMLGLMAIMFASTVFMISVLFSAIVTERRRELGLLRAIGARRGQVLGILLAEAALATGAGGLVGCIASVLLLRVYEHSLAYHLETLGIPFVWLSAGTITSIALLCILFASLVGAAGALYPAWRASREEPYDLIRSEG